MKARHVSFTSTVIFPLAFAVLTGWSAWHNAHTILPQEKRLDFVISILSFQFGSILVLEYFLFRYKKDPGDLTKHIKISGFFVCFPLFLLIVLGWYLQFWPGPYR